MSGRGRGPDALDPPCKSATAHWHAIIVTISTWFVVIIVLVTCSIFMERCTRARCVFSRFSEHPRKGVIFFFCTAHFLCPATIDHIFINYAKWNNRIHFKRLCKRFVSFSIIKYYYHDLLLSSVIISAVPACRATVKSICNLQQKIIHNVL